MRGASRAPEDTRTVEISLGTTKPPSPAAIRGPIGPLGSKGKQIVQCTQPIYLQQMDLHVPCGRCAACKKQRANEWSTRLLHESYYHEHMSFLTLTYSDSYLVRNVSKDVFQKFMKRLRKALPDRNIKYYACGEYGEKGGRPHYHAILYGVKQCGHCLSCCPKRNIADRPDEDCNTIRNIWPYGYCQLGEVVIESIRYVCGYINKSLHHSVWWNELKTPPFSLMSKRLGEQYCIDNEERLRMYLEDTINGNPIGLPKYYVKKLEIPTAELAAKATLKKEERLEHYKTKYGDDNEEHFDGLNEIAYQKKRISDSQRDRNIQAKERLTKRDYEI